MSGVMESKLTKSSFDALIQTRTPVGSFVIDPCGPELTKTDSAELSVLFPIGTDSKTIPAMGGSIIKISFGSIDKLDSKYKAYYTGINDSEIATFNTEEVGKLAKKNTSAIRILINKLLINTISKDLNLNIVPSIYLSSTTSDLSTLDKTTDYFGIIRKNAKFGFVPIESIVEILKDISSQTINGEIVSTVIGGWSGISGKTYFELYNLVKQSLPNDDDLIKIIMDIFPFFNLSEQEMLTDPVTPPLGGYFTIVGDNIYLKAPDFSGLDSAGYGSDYLGSGINLLFQVILDGDQKNSFSVKNIELKKQDPIFGSVISYTETYDLKSPREFTVVFSASRQPSSVYLSPVINQAVSVKNALFSGLSSSQSGTFIEYNPYPNPFISIFDQRVVLEGSESGASSYAKNIDYPFSKILFSDFVTLKSVLNRKYNKDLDISNYISEIFSGSGKASDVFNVGFPFDQDLLQISGGVINQSLSAYEFAGNLSRQNLILHNGVAADSSDEASSGKSSNNSKYFRKEFIANPIGLCENYRPRVFTNTSAFVPTTWIKGSPVTTGEQTYSVTFKATDIKRFYTDSATKMKFVMYWSDGISQISKFENGYLEVTLEPPEIESIAPNGTISGGSIISCGDSFAGTNTIRISTPSGNSVDTIFINDVGLKKEDVGWIAVSDSITLDIPCETGINEGLAEIVLAIGDVRSSPGTIYIANGALTQEETTSVSDLPSELSGSDLFHVDDVSSDNLLLSLNYEIPISYSDPRAKIKIKSKKKIFKSGREIYLYLGFENKTDVRKFSQEYSLIESKKVYVAKDFYYKLSNLLSNDFYRENNGIASLFFPGNDNISKPLGLLALDKAYFIISTKDPTNFITTDVLGVLQVGRDADIPTGLSKKRAFVQPPLIVGIAAKYYNGSSANHLNNFGQPAEYKKIADKLLDIEISSDHDSVSSISTIDKFRKLIILFKYREFKKFKKNNFKLYIKDSLVTSLFSLDGVKKVSTAIKLDDSLMQAAEGLYYFIVKDLLVSTADDAAIRVDIYDADFSTNTSTKTKIVDISHRVDEISSISKGTDPNGSSFTSKDIIISNGYTEVGTGNIFGAYQTELALTGIFAGGAANDVIDLALYPSISIKSNTSGVLSGIQSPSDSDFTVQLLKSVSSGLISRLPNAFFKIPSGAEILSNEYIAGTTDNLLFVRFEINDICKLSSPIPAIVSISSSEILVPGDKVIIEVSNVMQTFVIEIAGVEAKIIDVVQYDSGVSKATVIVPEGISSVITANDCGVILYNGSQVLNAGLLDLGKELSGTLERTASGLLDDSTHQFEQLKTMLLEHPLRLVSTKIDKANLPKEMMTSFCNFSFKITGDLSVNLQGFTQLLVPVRVILCIIDVICNLFNPFQLPSAIIRLFECLYDLILLLPQISIPVMFLSLLIHILDLLECLIVKVSALITVIALFIDAIVIITSSDNINYRDLLALEQLLMKYVIALEADLEFMGPITQVLAIFLQLLSLAFRFPCSVNPSSTTAPCGIDGFEMGSMISGLIAEQTGSAPHIKYKFKKQYLLPVCQPFTTEPSATILSPPSYNFATEPVSGSEAFDGTDAVDNNLFDISYFNTSTLRKKIAIFDPDTDDITDVDTDTYISLVASYTKRRKSLESAQSVIFDFDRVTWPSLFTIFDNQVIDENSAFDTPITLFTANGATLNISDSDSAGNFYSLIDGLSMITEVVDNVASVNPLVIDMVQNGVTVTRTFDTIPAMVLLDEEFNVYVIEDNGITFSTYRNIDDTTDILGISQIRATIMNAQSSTIDSFNVNTQIISSVPETKDIFSLPQLYFVDTRVAAEAIQSKCQTSSINQLPLDISGDGGAAEIQKVSDCIDQFILSISQQTGAIKSALAIGKVPEKISVEKVNDAYGTLVACTSAGIDNICSIVVNPLNTSFLLSDDTDNTPILPDPVLSDEILSGFESTGPALTGAREYAGGVGDAATITVGDFASISIIPRDSYDNIINYDISNKIKIEIISDSTGNAALKIVPTDSDVQNYIVYEGSASGSYSAMLTASAAGEVKIKASICGSTIQAITYGDLADISSAAADTAIDCVAGSGSTISSESIPLGALSRINRILTITFVENNIVNSSSSSNEPGIILTEPQLVGSWLEN